VPRPEKCTKQDVDQLRERLIPVWCELDQSAVNHAIDEWRRRLSACVDAEGGHFERFTPDNHFPGQDVSRKDVSRTSYTKEFSCR